MSKATNTQRETEKTTNSFCNTKNFPASPAGLFFWQKNHAIKLYFCQAKKLDDFLTKTGINI